jgi:hypothetical protein
VRGLREFGSWMEPLIPRKRLPRCTARLFQGPNRRCAVLMVGISHYLRTAGLVLLQVGTAFVTPTDGQLYDPTDGAVTVPMEVPDVP